MGEKPVRVATVGAVETVAVGECVVVALRAFVVADIAFVGAVVVRTDAVVLVVVGQTGAVVSAALAVVVPKRRDTDEGKSR